MIWRCPPNHPASRRRGVAPGRNMLLNAPPGRHIAETHLFAETCYPAPLHAHSAARGRLPESERGRLHPYRLAQRRAPMPGFSCRGPVRAAPGSPDNSGNTVSGHYYFNTGEILPRYCRDTGEILPRYWRDTGEILRRYWRDTGEILARYWRDTGDLDIALPRYWRDTA
jgi:hypothetical protein